jgi:hypothetical protein
MATSKPKPELELSILLPAACPPLKGEWSGDTSIFWRLQFITINQLGEVRNPSDSWGDDQFAGFKDLVFRCWISWANGGQLQFASELLYNAVYSVELRDAERMVKTLRRAQKLSAALIVRPKTFGEFVAMMGAAFGVKRYAQVEGRDGGWHNETRHSFHAIGALAERIDDMIERARWDKFGEKPDADVA